MPRAPGPLPPWAKALEAALRFLGQHLARLRHQLGRQLAKVARRGPKKTLALGAPPPENASSAPEGPPELLPKLEAEPAEALFTSFDLLLLAGALAVVAFVAWQSYKRRDAAVVRSVTPPLTPEDKALLNNGPDASISRRWPQPRPLIAAISARSSRTQKSSLTQ